METQRSPRVYVAGPLSTTNDKSDRYTQICGNIKRAIDAGDTLLNWSFAPYVPHYTHYWNLHSMHGWDTWLRVDHAFLMTCDALLRLPGASRGADQEVKWAEELGIPIFYTMQDLFLHFHIPVVVERSTGAAIREAINEVSESI